MRKAAGHTDLQISEKVRNRVEEEERRGTTFLRVGSAQRTTARHLSGGYIRRCNVTTGIKTSLIPPGTRLSVPPTPREHRAICHALAVSRFGVDRCLPEEDSGAQPVHLRDFTDPYSRPIQSPSGGHGNAGGYAGGSRRVGSTGSRRQAGVRGERRHGRYKGEED